MEIRLFQENRIYPYYISWVLDHILFVMLSASREAWYHLLHKYHLFKPQYPFVWKANGYVWIWKVMFHGGNSFQSHCTPATYPMFICWTMFYHRCVAKIRPHGTILQRRTISRTIIQKKIETFRSSKCIRFFLVTHVLTLLFT